MNNYLKLKGPHSFEPPHFISRAAYLSVQLNVLAFVIVGLTLMFANLYQGGEVSPSRVSFLLIAVLSPIWLMGAHYSIRFLRLRKPSLSYSLQFLISTFWKIGLGGALAYFILYRNEILITTQVIALVVLFFGITFCCFITLGYINGRFGVFFSFFNLCLLVYTLSTGGSVEFFQWFSLFGLIPVDSRVMQIVLFTITILLGLTQKTLSLFDFQY